jgi:hypothetical protein
MESSSGVVKGRLIMMSTILAAALGITLAVAPTESVTTPEEKPAVQPEPAASPDNAVAEELPKAEDLFKRHVEAIGGKEKMKQITSRRVDGRYVGRPFDFAARLTLWQEYPNKFHLKIREPAGVTIELAFDGKVGWERQPGIGLRLVEGIRLKELRDTANFWGEANWEDRYVAMDTIRTVDNFSGQEAYVVLAKSLSGREKLVVFSKKSGLYLGTITMTVSPDTGEPAQFESVLKAYKEFGGVKYPMGMVQRFSESEDSTVIDYAKVEINSEEKHEFSPPEELRKAIEEAEKVDEDNDD